MLGDARSGRLTSPKEVKEAKWIRNELDDVAAWARIRFKPRNSRSIVIRNGQVTSKLQLQVQKGVIPSTEEDPVKSLGKWYDASLNDRSSISRTERQAEE